MLHQNFIMNKCILPKAILNTSVAMKINSTSSISRIVISGFVSLIVSVTTFADEMSNNNQPVVNSVNVTVQQHISDTSVSNYGLTNISSLPSNAFNSSVEQDSLKTLIEQQQTQLDRSALTVQEQRSVRPLSASSATNKNSSTLLMMDYNSWLNSSSYRVQEVNSYQSYLQTQLGMDNVPPMEQLLTTARDWQECGYEPYQLPPRSLWGNIVPTLKLYSDLKQQNIIPSTAQIRSVYRPAELNACAGGASGSKHLMNAAIDIWVPEYEFNPWSLSVMQDNLCTYQLYYGKPYNFGLGLYETGAIHLDSQGYRKWGQQHTYDTSVCRVPLED